MTTGSLSHGWKDGRILPPIKGVHKCNAFSNTGFGKMPYGTLVAHWPCKKGGFIQVRVFSRVCRPYCLSGLQPPLPPKLALQKGRPLSKARFSRRSSAIQPLRLSSLSCPKTLGAVFCAGLRHPVSARLSQAVCLGPPLCGSLPSLLGSGSQSFLPQSSSCACLWRLPTSWRGTVPRGAPHSPQALVGLLSRSGGLSFTCLVLWGCLWGAV